MKDNGCWVDGWWWMCLGPLSSLQDLAASNHSVSACTSNGLVHGTSLAKRESIAGESLRPPGVFELMVVVSESAGHCWCWWWHGCGGTNGTPRVAVLSMLSVGLSVCVLLQACTTWARTRTPFWPPSSRLLLLLVRHLSLVAPEPLLLRRSLVLPRLLRWRSTTWA